MVVRALLVLTAQSKEVAVLGDSAVEAFGIWEVRESLGLGMRTLRGLAVKMIRNEMKNFDI